jgi:hypothetical protein
MRSLPAFALLGCLLPGLVLAQGGGAMTPVQRCEQTYGSCVRDCSGPNAQRCMAGCAEARAFCIQNPSTAIQPRR